MSGSFSARVMSGLYAWMNTAAAKTERNKSSSKTRIPFRSEMKRRSSRRRPRAARAEAERKTRKTAVIEAPSNGKRPTPAGSQVA